MCSSEAKKVKALEKRRRQQQLLQGRRIRVQQQQQQQRVSSFSAFRRARRTRRQLITREEYEKLRLMVPAVAKQPQVTKVQVIEEAIKYIDSLHLALFQRLRAQAPSGSPVVSVEEIGHRQLREWIAQLLPSASIILDRLEQLERDKKWPTFLEKADQMARKKRN